MAVRSSADKLAARVRAFAIIKEKSFRRGEFTLVSGRKSEFYLDMKPTMFDPEGANLLAELVLEKLNDMRVDCVGGLAMGAIPIVTAVSMRSVERPRAIPAFVVRKEVKDHGTRKRIEGGLDLKGKTVVILDDVTTSGGSAMEAVKSAQEAGATVALVLGLVDRGEGATEFYRAQNIAFDYLFHVREFLAATA